MEIAGLFESTRHNLSKGEIEEKSAQLLVKLIRCPDAATREEICRWIEECPAHAVAFAEAEAAWDAAELLKATCVETTEAVTAQDNAAPPLLPTPGHIRDDGRRAAVRARRRSADRPD